MKTVSRGIVAEDEEKEKQKRQKGRKRQCSRRNSTWRLAGGVRGMRVGI